jgi:hypothetical protein
MTSAWGPSSMPRNGGGGEIEGELLDGGEELQIGGATLPVACQTPFGDAMRHAQGSSGTPVSISWPQTKRSA